jgi:hypothetical protein
MESALRWFGVVWLAACLGGMAWLIDHGVRPGHAAAAEQLWPAGSAVQRHAGRATLVVLVHPYCPCSVATLIELGEIIAKTGNGADVTVLFSAPEDLALDFSGAPALARARALPGVTVLLDPGAHEADRFGAFTSGQTLLFAASGQLLFQGGITPSRGHLGDSAGKRALVALIAHGHAEQPSSPVYGCALRGEKL